MPLSRFLDVGFGGGATLSRLLRAGHRGSLAGVDFSEDMVRRAEPRFARPIAAGRLSVSVGDVVAMPVPDAAFDRVLTANTVYFWADLEGSFRSIARVLRPEGRLVGDGREVEVRGTRHHAEAHRGPVGGVEDDDIAVRAPNSVFTTS